MGLSFKDSLKIAKAEEANNTVDDEFEFADASPMSLASDLDDGEFGAAVYSDDTENWKSLNDKYPYYEDYSDDNISDIDDEKNISLNPKQFNITQEENSQYIPFVMPRYYDGFDLINTSIMIHYVNENGYEDRSQVVNVYYNDSKIKFAWLVGKTATAIEGVLQFEIEARGVNSKGQNYVLKTKSTNKLNVLRSLSGNGTIEPDQTWITSFMTQVTDKVAEAQGYANDAKASAQSAKDAVNSVTTNIDQTIGNKVRDALVNYYMKSETYNKNEVDDLIKNIDISSQLDEVKQQIADIDGLVKFNVEYNDPKLSFFNGNTLIKEVEINGNPSAEWTSAYTARVEEKIDSAKTEMQGNLNEYKKNCRCRP